MTTTLDPTTPTGWRGLPSTVWILVAARAVNRLGAFTLPFLALTLVADLGATVAQAGYLLAGFGLATIPSRLLGGRLADAIGGRATIVAGLVGCAAAMLGVAGSRTLTQAAVAVVALGLVFEVYEPPSQSLIADVTTPEQRPLGYGLLAAAMAVAGMAAGLLAAVLAGLDLRWLFVVDAVTCLVCAGVVLVLLPPDRPASRPAPDPVGGVWGDRRLLALLATGTVFAVIYLQITIALPLTLAARGHPASLVGVLLTVSAATMVAGQALLGRPWLRRLDDFHAMALGYLLLGGGLLLNGVVTSVPGFLAATVAWSVGDLVLLGRAYTIVAGIAPEGSRGRYLAVYGTSWGLAGIAAPLLGTQLLDRGGPVLAWSATAALCGGLALLQPALRRRCGPRIAE